MVLCQILTLVWKSKCIWILTDKKACGKVNRNASYIQQRFVPLIWSSFHSSKCSYNTWRPVNYWAAAASGWATSLSSSDLTPSLTMVIQSKNEQQRDFTPQNSSQCLVYISSRSPGAVCGLTEQLQPASCATCQKKYLMFPLELTINTALVQLWHFNQKHLLHPDLSLTVYV